MKKSFSKTQNISARVNAARNDLSADVINYFLCVVFLGLGIWYQKIPALNDIPFLFPISLVLEFLFLLLSTRFLLRDRYGVATISALFMVSQLGFLFAAVNGLLGASQNILFYLMPLTWIAGYSTFGKTLFAVVLALIPESFLWFSHQVQIHPLIPSPFSLPANINNISDFWLGFGVNILVLFLLPLRVSLVKGRIIKKSDSLFDNAKSASASSTTEATSESDLKNEKGLDAESQLTDMEIQDAAHKKILASAENIDLKGVLDSIVYFMSKNFKANTALGFLAMDGGRNFVMNSKFSRSRFIREDALIYPGSGLIAKGIDNPVGFMSGNIKTYPDKIEYYGKNDEINSVMVSRVMDPKTGRILGLLVVDSQAIRAFDDSDKELLNRFSKVASQLVTNAQLSKDMARVANRNQTIYTISKELADQKNQRGVIEVLIENLRKVFEADRLVFCAYNTKEAMGQVIRLTGDDGDVKKDLLFNITDPYSLYAQCFVNKIEYLETEFSRENRYRFNLGEKPTEQPAEVMVIPLLDDENNCLAVIGLETNSPGRFQKDTLILLKTIMTNASAALARAKMISTISRQANIDGLTQISNHRNFQVELDKQLELVKASRRPLGLLLMDIDHFKIFNDTYGHQLGDEVLRLVAACLQKTVRGTDMVARYGGEEFVVMLKDTTLKTAFDMGERIRMAIEEIKIPFKDQQLSVTVSIGAACIPDNAHAKRELIEAADQAMYLSKKSGRNQTTVSLKRNEQQSQASEVNP
jgi:diguanylate cyclase (GGDEF)-like protein